MKHGQQNIKGTLLSLSLGLLLCVSSPGSAANGGSSTQSPGERNPSLARCMVEFEKTSGPLSYPASSLYARVCSELVLTEMKDAQLKASERSLLLSRAAGYLRGHSAQETWSIKTLLRRDLKAMQRRVAQQGAEIRAYLAGAEFHKAKRTLSRLERDITEGQNEKLELRIEELKWRVRRSMLQHELDAVGDLLTWRKKKQPMARGVVHHAAMVLERVKARIKDEQSRAPLRFKAIERRRSNELNTIARHAAKLDGRLAATQIDHSLRRALEAQQLKLPALMASHLEEATGLMDSDLASALSASKRKNFKWRIRQLTNRLERAKLNEQWTKEWHVSKQGAQEVEERAKLSVHCTLPDDFAIFVTPERPSAERPLEIIALSRGERDALQLRMFGPLDQLDQVPEDTPALSLRALEKRGPHLRAWTANSTPKSPGLWRIVASAKGVEVGCINVSVEAQRRSVKRRGYRLKRTKTRSWGPQEELFYSLWIQHLFNADEGTTWPSLDRITRDSERNLLHNHLDLGEDNPDAFTQRRASLERLPQA